MTKYKTIKNRFITEFIEKYSDDSNRHFIQVLKKWRDLEKWNKQHKKKEKYY